MTKFVCISDTHNNYPVLPKGDVLIHSGDWTGIGSIREIVAFLNWISHQDFKHIVIVAGNHDFLPDNNPNIFKTLLQDHPNITYLENSSVEINGLKIYGSPVTPTFFDWAFLKDRGEEIAKVWQQIPEDIDVLITHGPPMGIRDQIDSTKPVDTKKGKHLGCQDLTDRLKDLKNLKLHVFGHIHAGYGITEQNGTVFANASICDESYDPVNEPLVIDISK